MKRTANSGSFKKGLIPWNKGKKAPQISKAKKGIKRPDMTGPKHAEWKGDDVKRAALFEYVRNHKPRPEDGLCGICQERPYHVLANMTGEYKRDFSNWQYLCILCHKRFYKDALDMESRKCCTCGSSKTYTDPDGHVDWYIVDKALHLYRCKNCYERERRLKKTGLKYNIEMRKVLSHEQGDFRRA